MSGDFVPRKALDPHKYPIWIYAFGAVVLAACIYSALSLPKYYGATRELRTGKSLDMAGDHLGAQQAYRAVLASVPSSREGKLGLAYALFADDDATNDKQALELLQGIKLSKDEWEHIKTVMPAAYQADFGEVKS